MGDGVASLQHHGCHLISILCTLDFVHEFQLFCFDSILDRYLMHIISVCCIVAINWWQWTLFSSISSEHDPSNVLTIKCSCYAISDMSSDHYRGTGHYTIAFYPN